MKSDMVSLFFLLNEKRNESEIKIVYNKATSIDKIIFFGHVLETERKSPEFSEKLEKSIQSKIDSSIQFIDECN